MPVSDSKPDQKLPPESPSDAAADAKRPDESKGTRFRPPPKNAETKASTGKTSPDLKDRMLGEFKLLRQLGQGGMAEVYLAEQTSLKRQVAIKILRAELLSGSDDVLLHRFEQEAKAAAGLNHPNIVQVYVVGEEDGFHFIAQEYVQGPNLREYLVRKGPPPTLVALRIMRQVASALQKASEAGIVHRDIKPENIMLTRKGEVKVADFGLAQLAKETEQVHLTQIGTTMGTPLYMSPEQIDGKKVDRRSDIYSLGVTCYHMLAGKPPFRGETAMSIAVQHINNEPEPLKKLRPDLPRALCKIVHTMMSKQPADRFQDAESVLQKITKLTSLLSENPDAVDADFDLAGVSGSSKTLLERYGQWRGKRQFFTFVWVCLLVGGLSAGVGYLTRPSLGKPSSESSSVPKFDSASAQFIYASRLVNNEVAWKAVEKEFPDDELVVRRAQEQLAFLYLRNARLGEARSIFDDFKRNGRGDVDLRMTALVGLAIVASLEEDYTKSQAIIAGELLILADEHNKQLNGEIGRLLDETIVRNQENLGAEAKNNLDALFNPEEDDTDETPPGQ